MHSVGGTLGPLYDSLTASGPGPAPKNRKERKLSLLLRRTEEQVHCAGVEALALTVDGSTLFTGSRDATVRAWTADGPAPGAPLAAFEGHSGWVNDVAVVGDALVSCSADCGISVWDADARGPAKAEATLYSHSDYVTCLAAAKDVPVVVSGGLRGQVMLWDVPTTVAAAQQGQNFRSIDQSSPLGSIYALAINGPGNIVAVGSPEGLLRISDARTVAKSFKLRGHTDNIRALLLNDDGTLALSASSDHTIRLWDLGQQRCLHTFAVHTDSVWTLWAPDDFSVVYSGGRDACVYRTHVASRSSELLFEEGAPVNRLLMAPDGMLWCATTDSTVRGWDVPEAEVGGGAHPLPVSPRTPSRGASGRIFHAGQSPQVRQRQRFAGGAKPEAAASVPRVRIQGLPPLTRFVTLPDRRHVLTQDAGGQVEMWDISQAAIVERLGKMDLAEAERQKFRPDSIAPWFAADVKLGSLALHLEPPSCFSAEVYAVDLGRAGEPDDLKYNFGEHLLKAVLSKWVAGLAASYVASGTANGAGPAELVAAASCFHLRPGVSPLISSSLQPESHRSWTKAANELTGAERVGELIPKWAAEAVLHQRFPAPPELKCAFVLVPAEGSGLPSLLQSRLNAPRILRIQKVASYVIGKLSEEGLSFEPRRLYYDPALQSQLEARQRDVTASVSGSETTKELEFVCNGHAVPFDLSLAAVRAFVWRRSDSVTMQYRVFNPSKPAPFPVIKPPP